SRHHASPQEREISARLISEWMLRAERKHARRRFPGQRCDRPEVRTAPNDRGWPGVTHQLALVPAEETRRSKGDAYRRGRKRRRSRNVTGGVRDGTETGHCGRERNIVGGTIRRIT